jgi:hypothetical protein
MRRLHAGILVKNHHFSTFRSGIFIGIALPALVAGLYHSLYHESFPLFTRVIMDVVRFPAEDQGCYSWMGRIAVRVRHNPDTRFVFTLDWHQLTGMVPLTYKLRVYIR